MATKSDAIKDLLADLADFERMPDSAGYDLRNDLAEIILRHLDGKNWTQSRLALIAGMKSPFLTRIIHSDQNCTFDVAGRILFALGVKVKLMECLPDESESSGGTKQGNIYAEKQVKEHRDEKAITLKSSESDIATAECTYNS